MLQQFNKWSSGVKIQARNVHKIAADKVVISGISGRFPGSRNFPQFGDCLFNGTDLVTEQTRFKSHRIPKELGLLKEIDKFDASFFGVPPKQAHAMDPILRMLLEVTFEAIIDAGLNPVGLRRYKVGVFAASGMSEALESRVMSCPESCSDGYSIEPNPLMIPNRTSFYLNLTGPSVHINTGCSSGLIAMEMAIASMDSGTCDMAIVAGGCVHLNPAHFAEFKALRVTSPDGRSKSFDEAANGFGRAEAVVALLLQRMSTAKRCYATVEAVRSVADGFKQEGISHPSQHSLETLLGEIYKTVDVDQVKYVECHGSGTPIGDPIECDALAEAFAQAGRSEWPLLIGSVKSNTGHAEAAAALNGVAKVLLTFIRGELPRNLHFKSPNNSSKSLSSGQLQVVSDGNVPFNDGLIGVTSIGIGGTTAHALLRPYYVAGKKSSQEQISLPPLILMSGRTEIGLENGIRRALGNAEKTDFLGLLHQSFRHGIEGHNFRGFGIPSACAGDFKSNIVVVKNCQNSKSSRRPMICFAFSGPSSTMHEWEGIETLMDIEVFKDSIASSQAAIGRLNIDIDLTDLTRDTEKRDSRTQSFVLSSALQIALIDTLKVIGIVADDIVGQSFIDELFCGYVDGALSAEQALLMVEASCRLCEENGISLLDTAKLEHDPDADKRLHALAMANFCDILGDTVMVASSKWKQAASAENGEKIMYSAEHFANFLVRSLMSDSLSSPSIPKNALVIHIGPSSLCPTGPNCIEVCPSNTRCNDAERTSCCSWFLEVLGKLYVNGVDMDIAKLYPSVEFPVPSDTPPLSELVSWDHQQSWHTGIISYPKFGGQTYRIDVTDPNYSALRGHRYQDSIVMPGAAYLFYAWQNYADSCGIDFREFPVEFREVYFPRMTLLSETRPTDLVFLKLNGNNGEFEFHEGDEAVCRGKVSRLLASKDFNESMEQVSAKLEELSPGKAVNGQLDVLLANEFYKELRLRGFNFLGAFQSIKRIDINGNWAEVKYTGDWISFIDGILQSVTLKMDRKPMFSAGIEQIRIHPQQLLHHISSLPGKPTVVDGEISGVVPVEVMSQNRLRCPGVTITGIETAPIPWGDTFSKDVLVQAYSFHPFFQLLPDNAPTVPMEDKWWQTLGLVLENRNDPSKTDVSILSAFVSADEAKNTADIIEQFFASSPKFDLSLTQVLVKDAESEDFLPSPDGNYDLIVTDSPKFIEHASERMKRGFFVLSVPVGAAEYVKTSSDIRILSRKCHRLTELVLIKKIAEQCISPSYVKITADSFDWVPQLSDAIKASFMDKSVRIFITADQEWTNGIISLVRCLRLEPGGDKLRCIFSADQPLDLHSSTVKNVLENDLAFNIFQDGQWGSYAFVPLSNTAGNDKSSRNNWDFPVQQVNNAHVAQLKSGDVSSLSWVASPSHVYEHTGSQNVYTVSHVGLNFRDTIVSSGGLPPPRTHDTMSLLYGDELGGHYPGYEFSGWDGSGRKVMGIKLAGALSTKVIGERLTWDVPESWSLEEAATVPIAYVTALYALVIRGRLNVGESVLIHSGSGGVGQAAIRIALSVICKVYTTVGSNEKREKLKQVFPELRDENIWSSRDCSFESQIMNATNGEGVDVVLNSLAGDKLHASIRCLARGGRFLEIGASDASQRSSLSMSNLLKDTEFHGIMLHEFILKGGSGLQKLWQLFQEGLTGGLIKPFTQRRVFRRNQIPDALHVMRTSAHTGKILIDVHGAERPQSFALGKTNKIQALTRTYFFPEKVYLVVGGTGGVGLEFCTWLIRRGARHLVINSRSGIINGYQSYCLKLWESQGAKVHIVTADLSNLRVAQDFLQKLKMPVGGVFIASLMLRDGLLRNLTAQDFDSVMTSKGRIASNLDLLLRQCKSNPDYFVTFSSLASGGGNAGASPYNYGNSVVERICEHRKKEGLHGLAIQLGVVGQVGHVAEKGLANTSGMTFNGYGQQPIQSVLRVLDIALQKGPECPPVIATYICSKDSKRTEGGERLTNGNRRSSVTGTILRIFGISEGAADLQKKLSELGMDSLTATMVNQSLRKEHGLRIPIKKLRALSLAQLEEMATNFHEEMA